MQFGTQHNRMLLCIQRHAADAAAVSVRRQQRMCTVRWGQSPAVWGTIERQEKCQGRNYSFHRRAPIGRDRI